MATETTYTSLRENLASVLDRVFEDREIVIVRRKGSKDVALVRRLLTALRRAELGKTKPRTVDQLRREIHIDPGS